MVVLCIIDHGPKSLVCRLIYAESRNVRTCHVHARQFNAKRDAILKVCALHLSALEYGLAYVGARQVRRAKRGAREVGSNQRCPLKPSVV
jgi:hypothetical protein